MTLTPVFKRLAVVLSIPVLKTSVCPDRESNSNLPHARRTLYHNATAAVKMFFVLNLINLRKKNSRYKQVCHSISEKNIYLDRNSQVNKLGSYFFFKETPALLVVEKKVVH